MASPRAINNVKAEVTRPTRRGHLDLPAIPRKTPNVLRAKVHSKYHASNLSCSCCGTSREWIVIAVVQKRAHEAQRRLPQAHQYRIPVTAGGLETALIQARRTKTQKTACTARNSSDSRLGVTEQFYTE